jgi:lipoprotein-releasing system permease protein
VEDPLQAFAVQRDLNHRLKPPLTAQTWMDLNRSVFEAVAMEKRVMAFILLFVMLVAAFGICSTLITVTVQKAREIGIMKALGALNTQIIGIFTLYGLAVGVAGSIMGTAWGLVILQFRNEFSQWLGETFGISVFPAEVYHFSQIPAVVDPWTILWIALAGIGLSTLAALIPAFLAARVDPVRSLHGE